MARKYKILVTLLLLSYITSSQIDTSKICLPYNVVQNISIELIQKDSLENELHETQNLITVYKTKISFQDSTITLLEQKEENYLKQISNLTKQDSLHTKEVTRLREENTNLNRKNKNLKTTTKILGGGFLGAIAALIILL
jgi:chromosome segregation ATPase